MQFPFSMLDRVPFQLIQMLFHFFPYIYIPNSNSPLVPFESLMSGLGLLLGLSDELLDAISRTVSMEIRV
jgi:hypothetical protein